MPVVTATALARAAYSPAETAELLSVSRQHVYALINQGRLPVVKLGRASRIPATAIAALLEDGADARTA